jgi:2-amino-4-hydroxy-6-hydroxymethyldihydropteridine diphosphokinase
MPAVDFTDLAFVAIGSNVGESRVTVERAMERLEQFSDGPLLRSSLYETEPVDCPPGSPPFINAVVGLSPTKDETPETLLSKLKLLEEEFGRTPKKVLNEPRALDLDIIAFRNERRSSQDLTIPHPRAHLRRFVLQPLSDLAPDFTLPGQTRTIRELLDSLRPSENVRRL